MIYKKIKATEEYRVNTVAEAKALIEEMTMGQREEGYFLVSAGYTHKEKKKKGEIIDECEVVKIVKAFSPLWEEIDNG